MNDGQSIYNRMGALEFAMTMLTFCWVLQDSSNNDLMEELQKQDREYLHTIIENQNRILRILSEIQSDMSVE